MKKDEFGTLLSSVIVTAMALVMSWCNYRFPRAFGGPRLPMITLLLILWIGAWMYHRKPQKCCFFRNAVSQSQGVAMGLWVYAGSQLECRMRCIAGSAEEWLLFGIFSIFFLWIVLTGGTSLKQDENQ